MVQRLSVDGEAVIPDDADNLQVDSDIAATITIDGGTEVVWERDAGGGNPITATLLISPSTLNPGGVDAGSGSFTQLLNTITPNGHALSEAEKSIDVSMHNIAGGDGGPYTVDYSGVSFVAIVEIICAGFGMERAVVAFVEKSYQGGTGASIDPVRTAATGGVDTTANGLTSVTGQIDYSDDPIQPLNQNGSSRIIISGSVKITDAALNETVFPIPQGSEGVLNGSGNQYQDSFLWGDDNCVIN